uniref:UBC core domain-containing protein n=1 Tax=Anser cygnoides TaxID=8845 RepID=A0A8B9IMB7_ANSCY
MSSSQKALMLELKSLQEEPVEGFRITLVDESDLYNWEVAIFGPPNTLYEGGYFKVRCLPRASARPQGLRRCRRPLCCRRQVLASPCRV